LAYNLAVKFEWDQAKNLANQKKHGVSFEEAESVFAAADYLEIFDEELLKARSDSSPLA
jgi:uncharacterized DUF497 family protein